jgi:3-hydroxybutyryl-CoA dehydrogenase
MKSIGVVGAGTMGHGIAQVLVKSGFSVVLQDVAEKILDAARERIGKGLARDVEKGRLTAEQREQALGRLKTTTEVKDLAGVELAIEAVVENFETKQRVFRALEPVVREAKPEAILASNTSSISITRLAAQTGRPERFVGLHFFNPVPVMKLVEVVPGLETAPETVKAAEELATALGKTPIRVNDYPGFVSNRVLMPMINEAAYCVMEGVADAQAVDGVMKLGMNHPMGPLALADLIGLDTCLAIMETLYDGFKDSKYRPCPLLRKYVEAGWLGKKVGKGFYEY